MGLLADAPFMAASDKRVGPSWTVADPRRPQPRLAQWWSDPGSSRSDRV